MEIDAMGAAAGALAGGTVAQAVDPQEGHAGHSSHDCADCGTPVTGKFCSECGQPAHVHRTLLHLGHELLHGVMHFDGRIWRTVPLLFANPGKLTREWTEGRRTRYVSPLAIFLFTLFVLFFGLSFAPQPEMNIGNVEAAVSFTPEDAANMKSGLEQTRTELAQVEARLPESTGSERIELGMRKGALSGVVASLETQLDAYEMADKDANGAVQARADGLAPGSWQANIADIEGLNEGKGFWGKVGKKLKNPDFAFYKLQQTTYKFAFLLVPLSIPFMWLLLAWRRGYTLYDHGVFVLYSLTFMAMLTMLAVIIGSLVPALAGILGWLVAMIVPVHIFAQLKGAYSLSVFSALWRTLLLLVFCSIVLGLFVGAIVYLGLGH